MKRLFISYSRVDKDFAKRLAKSLKEVGADVWIDMEDIEAGKKWSTAVQEGLDTSDGLVVIISPDSMSSSNVEDEWQYFFDSGKPVIPVLLKPAKIHFQLHRLQYVDFSLGRFGDAFARLLDELEHKGLSVKVEAVEDTWIYDVRKSQQAPQTKEDEAVKPKNDGSKQATPRAVLVGILAFLVLGIGIVLPFLNNFAGTESAALSDFGEEAPPPVRFYFEGLEVEGDNGETMYFDEVIVSERFYHDSGEIWVRVYNVDTALYGYLPKDHLPLDDSQIYHLNFVPFLHRLSTTQIALFVAPDEELESLLADVDDEILVYGYRYDDDETLWYYVLVEVNGEKHLAWITDSEDKIGLVGSGEVPALAYTQDFTDAYWEDEREDYVLTIEPNQLVPVVSKNYDDENAYWVGYYFEGQWELYWVDGAKLDVNEITDQFIY